MVPPLKNLPIHQATNKMDHDTEHRDFPVCPHCGHEDRNGWDAFRDGSSIEEVDCPECDRAYISECITTITYTTRLVPGQNDQDHAAARVGPNPT